jgi:drug/metabolite transporter (DMT)-like permease
MTNDRLTLAQVLLLGTYAVCMSGGQVLFKMAAQRFPPSAAIGEQLTSLLGNTYFFVAFAFYCALALWWLWILTFTPLSRAYPFVALAFAITPMLGGWLFDESINLRLALGIAAIILGLVLVVG